jgi:hypothetical protein
MQNTLRRKYVAHVALSVLFALSAFSAMAQLSAAPKADSPAAAPNAFADLPARLKSPTDTAVFRRFVLDNGMKVLLVSDQIS